MPDSKDEGSSRELLEKEIAAELGKSNNGGSGDEYEEERAPRLDSRTILKLFWCLWCVNVPLFRNKRFQRALLAGLSIMLAFSGWLIFLFEFIEYDPPVSAWVPGVMGTLGFIALNMGYIPEDNGGRGWEASGVYIDGRMTPFEMFFVAALAWTMFPVVVSLFIMAIDYKHENEHTVAVALFFQTTCILISALSFMGARSMDVRDKKDDDDMIGFGGMAL